MAPPDDSYYPTVLQLIIHTIPYIPDLSSQNSEKNLNALNCSLIISYGKKESPENWSGKKQNKKAITLE